MPTRIFLKESAVATPPPQPLSSPRRLGGAGRARRLGGGVADGSDKDADADAAAEADSVRRRRAAGGGGGGGVGGGGAVNNGLRRSPTSRRSTKFRSSILEALSVRTPDAAAVHARAKHGNNKGSNNGNEGGGNAFFGGQAQGSCCDEYEYEYEHDDDDDDDEGIDDPAVARLSSDDIRASPRLLGYLFSMIASAVMLISVVQENTLRRTGSVQMYQQEAFFVVQVGAVVKWKLWGAMTVAGLGVVLNLLTILVHFGTLFPRLWTYVFRDGSLVERNWILFLVVFWIGGLHVCTSSLSVGELQANVYFTTWIAFASTLGNLSVWRESAGLPTMFDMISSQHRETTYNWMWTAFFSIIFAGAVTDIYYNRSEIGVARTGQALGQVAELQLSSADWMLVLIIVWTEVGVCFASIALNEWCYKLYTLPCRCRRKTDYYRCLMGWRQLEGFVILLALGGKFYVILEYTGVDGVINGLSNAYFGVWGSFFNSVFAFGSWIKESNKNITYIMREGDEEYE